MRRLLPYLAVTLASLALVAGCRQEQAAAQSPDAGAKAGASATPSTPSPTDGSLYTTPARLDACDRGAVVTVHWDMRRTHPEIADVEIWTGPVGNQTLFAAGGYTGEASTVQPWAYPGTVFSLRNKADGKEVVSTVVDGPACPQS